MLDQFAIYDPLLKCYGSKKQPLFALSAKAVIKIIPAEKLKRERTQNVQVLSHSASFEQKDRTVLSFVRTKP